MQMWIYWDWRHTNLVIVTCIDSLRGNFISNAIETFFSLVQLRSVLGFLAWPGKCSGSCEARKRTLKANEANGHVHVIFLLLLVASCWPSSCCFHSCRYDCCCHWHCHLKTSFQCYTQLWQQQKHQETLIHSSARLIRLPFPLRTKVSGILFECTPVCPSVWRLFAVENCLSDAFWGALKISFPPWHQQQCLSLTADVNILCLYAYVCTLYILYAYATLRCELSASFAWVFLLLRTQFPFGAKRKL